MFWRTEAAAEVGAQPPNESVQTSLSSPKHPPLIMLSATFRNAALRAYTTSTQNARKVVHVPEKKRFEIEFPNGGTSVPLYGSLHAMDASRLVAMTRQLTDSRVFIQRTPT